MWLHERISRLRQYNPVPFGADPRHVACLMRKRQLAQETHNLMTAAGDAGWCSGFKTLAVTAHHGNPYLRKINNLYVSPFDGRLTMAGNKP